MKLVQVGTAKTRDGRAVMLVALPTGEIIPLIANSDPKGKKCSLR